MMDDREQVLGYKPQKENAYNKLLPYKDDIDQESKAVLAEIKGNLGRAIQLRDLKVGAGHWVGQITRYIHLYGMKFSKEDHICLIKLLFEMTIIPDLEMSLVHKFAGQLTSLLKKKSLLSREDIVLPWRPLYKLMDSIMFSQTEQHGLLLLPVSLESVMRGLIEACRSYFPLESTQEMLDEWRPLLCPYDITVIKALGYMELFLPVNHEPQDMDKGFKLWFDEIMEMWKSVQNTPSWESSIVSLLSRLANNNIGHIDWSPYVSEAFTRLLRLFHLPVGTQSVQVGHTNNRVDLHPYIIWIVAMMGGGSNVQEHINKLFITLQNFYHPSNLGKWNIKLSSLLMTFPKVFIRRIHRERYKKPSWIKPILESHKLTDVEITQFVESMKTTVFTSMFSKYGSQDSALALRYLATMRPELIVPPLLEKMYPAMETLIEPHRLIACMNCIVAVVRPMLSSEKWYPEGKIHVLPLLNLSLPGIDPNDFKKCLVTFQMISTFVSLVTIVDCSEAVHIRTDLTEHEKELCSATAQFEDFVLQFLDKVFCLIDNSAQEKVHGNQDRLNPEQTMVEIGLASTFTSVLQQCSHPIFMSALRRLHTFISTSVYESKVGGRFAANLVRAAAKVNAEEALKTFMNTICDNILNFVHDHEDNLKDEQLDDGFLWNLLMLAQLVRGDGSATLKYREKLLEVLSYILKLHCIQGYEIAGQALRYLLRSLTMIYPLNYRSVDGSLDRPLSDYLPTRDWAKPGDMDKLEMCWHIPNAEEITFATDILEQVLQPELVSIKQISDENPMGREELLRRLNIVLECLNGAGATLSMWQGESVTVMDCQVPLTRFTCAKCDHVEVTILGGQNVRHAITDAMRPLLKYLMASCEDDTKNLFRLLRIYELVLFFSGTPKNEFDNRWKSFHMVKRALEDKMRGGKRHIRALLVDRVQLQHEMRTLHLSNRSFTAHHKELLEDLFMVSVSHYSEVRKKAQSVLFQTFQGYPYCYLVIVDRLVELLKNKDTPEHQFQGALYVLLGNSKRNIATKRNWSVIKKVWPAIIQSNHSEKPSILNLIDNIVSKTVKNVETTAIKILVNDTSLSAAAALLEPRVPAPSTQPCDKNELQSGVEFENRRNAQSLSSYEGLVSEIVHLVKEGNLTWKFCQIGVDLLSLMVRDDVPTPVPAVELFVQSCVHDSLAIRKLALPTLSAIQKQMKRRHKKVLIDPLQQAVQGSNVATEVCPGNRGDNSWHLYNRSNLPDTQEKWESLVVVEKTHWGFFTWPKQLEVYAPFSEQPKLNRVSEELDEGERVIYTAMMDKEYVHKLVGFLSLEENKSRDKFCNKRMVLFKGLFRNFGDCLLPMLKPHIERLIADTSHDKHDSSQRCAIELLAGILRGSKHWNYQQTRDLWEWAIPLLRTGLNNITVATHDDWATFYLTVSESRDPRKIYWLFEMFLENPLSGEGGSFGDAARLCMIQNALLQQEWRVNDLQHHLVGYLLPHLAHAYKNVRDRIGSMLSNVYTFDYKMFPNSQSLAPKKVDLFAEVLPKLDRLKEIVIEEAQHRNGNGNGDNGRAEVLETGVEKMDIENDKEESEERKELSRLCKTVMRCVINCVGRNINTAPPEIFPLLPILCTLESESKDEELHSDCTLALACISQALLTPPVIPVVLSTIKEIVGLQSWHARAAVLKYIQVMVFDNFFMLQQPQNLEHIKETVMHLICDDKLEVREMAAITLSGLLQCGYLKMDKGLLSHFERLSTTRIKKRTKLENIPMDKLIQRHAGVLGLSAYIQAYPYDVPELMPLILMDLSDHVHDPQPIQMTVKKTLSNFRRTHHDNWHDHKQMFTDDQLVILTDLLVSPNYYA